MNELKRGDVVLLNLGSGTGCEQTGERPAIIIQNNMGNKFAPTITVVPLTSKMMKKNLPTHLHLTKEQYPLPADSIALCEQVRTVDKKRIVGNVLFKLNQLEMRRLDKCMLIQMGIEMPVAQVQQMRVI